MDILDIHALEAIRGELRGVKASIAEDLLDNSAKNIEEYRHACGTIRGIDIAIAAIQTYLERIEA